MSEPLEIHLDHPIEVDNIRYDKLALSDFSALANFRTNSPEQIILSLSFNIPRRPSAARLAISLVSAVGKGLSRSLAGGRVHERSRVLARASRRRDRVYDEAAEECGLTEDQPNKNPLGLSSVQAILSLLSPIQLITAR
jgi:hypothetical protein